MRRSGNGFNKHVCGNRRCWSKHTLGLLLTDNGFHSERLLVGILFQLQAYRTTARNNLLGIELVKLRRELVKLRFVYMRRRAGTIAEIPV